MKELENFRKFLAEELTNKNNKYYIQTGDGNWYLNPEAAVNYLSQFKDQKAVERFIYDYLIYDDIDDIETYEKLPHNYEEHPTEESVEDALKQAMDYYFGDI
jgi:hypothetical protein